MYGFTGKDTLEKGQEFVQSLSDNERAKLEIAQKYYESELMLPESVAYFLRKKGITNEEAKNLLTNYIKSAVK
jgi:glutaminase